MHQPKSGLPLRMAIAFLLATLSLFAPLGASAQIAPRMQTNSDIVISINNVTCSGFDWTVTAPQEVRVYVSVKDTIGHGMIDYVPVNGTNLARTETYTVTTENQTAFNIMVSAYDPATDQELATKSFPMQCPLIPEPPTPPPPTLPPVTPTVTPPTATVAPDVGNSVTIQIAMPDGASIEGAPYSVFAPVASQAPAAPYAQGTVGANNTITLTDILPGEYQLLVSPAGMDPIEAMFEVGTGATTALKIVVHADGTVEVIPGTTTPPPTAGATESPDKTVSGLPETGAGDGQAAMPVLLFAMGAMLLAGISLMISRRMTIR